MVDVSPVIRGRYEAPVLCYGKTCAGRRCKLRTVDAVTCYGIEFATCRYHERQHVVYRWSLSRYMTRVPDKIKNYLIYYKHCLDQGLDEWLAVVLAAELFQTRAFLESTELVQMFRNLVFTPTSGECSICYEDGDRALRTRCGHVFCEPCLTTWTTSNVTCPMCRKIISQA